MGTPETVCFLFRIDGGGDDPLVCHLRHRECEIEAPHRMSECGRFVEGQMGDTQDLVARLRAWVADERLGDGQLLRDTIALIEAQRQALQAARNAMPDSETAGPDGNGFRYAWDDCTSDEQEWVKAVAAEVEAALTATPAGEEPQDSKCPICDQPVTAGSDNSYVAHVRCRSRLSLAPATPQGEK